MALAPPRLATVIVLLVQLTLLVSFTVVSLVLALAGNWEAHGWALNLTLKIIWGGWFVLSVTFLLTWVTIIGWRFRRMRKSEVPRGLAQALKDGIQPAAIFKSGTVSFTITVVMVSLLGVAVLATVLIWIIGDWQTYAAPLSLSLQIIWASWWVLCVLTVLLRVILFNQHQRRAKYARLQNGAVPETAGSTPRPQSTTENQS